jgi:hypothetical protein
MSRQLSAVSNSLFALRFSLHAERNFSLVILSDGVAVATEELKDPLRQPLRATEQERELSFVFLL